MKKRKIMKTIIYSLSAFLVLIVTSCNTQETVVGNASTNNTISNNKELSPSEKEAFKTTNLEKSTANPKIERKTR